MVDRVIAQADKCCVALHLLAWCAAATHWAVKWWRDGPAPAGPLYNAAKSFIGRLDILVQSTVHELTIWIAQSASARLSVNIGACLTITFGILILLAGTLQWFLLGRLVQWVARRWGQMPGLTLFGLFGLWAFGALFLWVAS